VSLSPSTARRAASFAKPNTIPEFADDGVGPQLLGRALQEYNALDCL
jgi:hypothetical protein